MKKREERNDWRDELAATGDHQYPADGNANHQ